MVPATRLPEARVTRAAQFAYSFQDIPVRGSGWPSRRSSRRLNTSAALVCAAGTPTVRSSTRP